MKKMVNMRLEESKIEELKLIAQKDNMSITDLTVKALDEYGKTEFLKSKNEELSKRVLEQH